LFDFGVNQLIEAGVHFNNALLERGLKLVAAFF
jgi:hypothetical protein